ncbi:hypothetical protein DXG01_007382 [Tephrocybe rancida]|nr:hypothetical protein DXG01_007382 [Tephrocybe rancida]
MDKAYRKSLNRYKESLEEYETLSTAWLVAKRELSMAEAMGSEVIKARYLEMIDSEKELIKAFSRKVFHEGEMAQLAMQWVQYETSDIFDSMCEDDDLTLKYLRPSSDNETSSTDGTLVSSIDSLRSLPRLDNLTLSKHTVNAPFWISVN